MRRTHVCSLYPPLPLPSRSGCSVSPGAGQLAPCRETKRCGAARWEPGGSPRWYRPLAAGVYLQSRGTGVKLAPGPAITDSAVDQEAYGRSLRSTVILTRRRWRGRKGAGGGAVPKTIDPFDNRIPDWPTGVS